MSFDLFAFAEVMDFSTDNETKPLRIHEPSKVQRVLIGNFATRKKAEEEITRIDLVSFALDGRDWVVPQREIRLFEIVQIP